MPRGSKRRPNNVASDQCGTCDGSGFVPNRKATGAISAKGKRMTVGEDSEGNTPPPGMIECGQCGGVGDSGMRGK